MHKSLATTLAERCPRQAQALVYRYGGPTARSQHQLAQMIQFIGTRGGPKAMRDIADIHPDKKLLMTNWNNACGCSHSNAAGPDGALADTEQDMGGGAAQRDFFKENQALIWFIGGLIVASLFIKGN